MVRSPLKVRSVYASPGSSLPPPDPASARAEAGWVGHEQASSGCVNVRKLGRYEER